jgi:hypothetical protein
MTLLFVVTAMALHCEPAGAIARSAAKLPLTNSIQKENSHLGNAAWRLKVLSYGNQIQGYSSAPSIAAGGTISFAVSTTGTTFSAVVYRMGWYGGTGARVIVTLAAIPGHRYPLPKPARSTGLIVCHWPPAFKLKIPHAWTSGIYLVKLIASNTHEGYIPFVITNPYSNSSFLFIHGLFTDEAYNDWGGKSLYGDHTYPPAQRLAHRAVKVSFSRPFVQNMGSGWFLSWEYQMVRWLERKGYDVTYATDLDVHRHPGILLHHRGIIIAGHDEYWSLPMRNGYGAAVGHGVGLANFAANSGYWQVRLEGKNQPVLVCYKDISRDPVSRSKPWLTTTLWRNPPVSRPESELLGAMYGNYEGSHGPYSWVVSDPHSWVFKGSGAQTGSSIPRVVGQESDLTVGGYPRPRGLQILSRSPIVNGGGARVISNATVYTARSGAHVFNAGAIEWSWGLDDVHQSFWLYHPSTHAPNKLAEKITANVLESFLKSRARN